MAKRKMVQINLLKNSIAAYFAAIEIHNKPNISYRYETVTLLMMNAWELLLKAYIRKHIKDKSIFENDGHTISFDKALTFTNDFINSKKSKSFTVIKENLLKIEQYRNNTAHFYNEQLEPYIFMLIARCALNFVEFVKAQFSKDIIVDEGLFIMPLGFKLPFKPEDFLSRKSSAYTSSVESKQFIDSIINIISDLKEQKIEESIVLGFDIYLESVKKVTNSDLLVAITNKNEADITISSTKKISITSDPTAQKVYLSDEEILKQYPFTYKKICEKCKEEIPNFKQSKEFNEILKELKGNTQFSFNRKLNPNNKKTVETYFYSEDIVEEIKKLMEMEARENAKTL